jgi:TolB-like protein/Tfp pilus assembly protein PilF
MNKPVFISHSSNDKAIANAICAAIEAQGVGVWIAPRDVVPGHHYGDSIIDAINACKVMVVVFSSHSNKSESVLREVERAVSKGVKPISFRIEDAPLTKSLEYFLSSPHWMDACARPIEPAIEKLAQFIRNLAKVGYDFDRVEMHAGLVSDTAPASLRQSLAALATRRKALLLASGGTVLLTLGAGAWWLEARGPRNSDEPKPDLLPAEAAVAVLPFRNLAGGQTSFLTLSMPVVLSAALARDTDLFVRPLSSVQAYADRSWLEIARTLRATTIIQGTITSAVPELRVILEINDARRNAEVWSDTLQGAPSDTLSLTDDMVRKVELALKLRLDQQPLAGTKNEGSYELFLRALNLTMETTDANNLAAIGLLEKAVKLDPHFSRAYAELAKCYVTRFWWNFSDEHSWLDLGERTARKALAIDSTSSDAHVALGYALEANGQRGPAARAYIASAHADPRNVSALENLARFLFYMAEFNKALAVLDRIAVIDPTSNVHVRKAMCYYFLGDIDECQGENADAASRARGVGELTLVAFTAIWLKDFGTAQAILKKLKAEQPDALSVLEIEAWISTMQRDFPAAQARMAEVNGRRQEYGIVDELATLYAIQGDKEQAIVLLEKAVKAGAPNLAWYKSDFFKIARGDPRYEAIVTQLSLEYRACLADYRA